MEEMMEETLDSVDDEEIEEEADAEVDKVLYELTDGKLGQAGAVGAALPVSHVRSIHKRTADSGMGYSGRGGRGERGGDAAYEKRNAGAVEFMMAVVDVGDVRMKKETSCYAHNIQCPLDIPCIIKNHMTIDPGYVLPYIHLIHYLHQHLFNLSI